MTYTFTKSLTDATDRGPQKLEDTVTNLFDMIP